MDQAVHVHLRTIQRGTDGTETMEESNHTGILQAAEDVLSLRYTDASAEDGAISEVFLCLSPGELLYRREGESSVEARYRAGEACDLCYHTPYGELHMCLYTKELSWCYDQGEGEMSLCYKLFSQEEEISETLLELSFTLSEADV